jgi:hypothetical protein
MFILDGKVLQIDLPFTHGELQYPATWLRTSSPEEKEAIGIIEIAEKIRPDDRFYWVDADNNGVPKDLPSLQAQWTQQIDQAAYSMLQPTDWYVVRKMEANVAVPDTVSALRSNVRAYASEIKDSIGNVTVVDDLISLVTTLSWPQS